MIVICLLFLQLTLLVISERKSLRHWTFCSSLSLRSYGLARRWGKHGGCAERQTFAIFLIGCLKKYLKSRMTDIPQLSITELCWSLRVCGFESRDEQGSVSLNGFLILITPSRLHLSKPLIIMARQNQPIFGAIPFVLFHIFVNNISYDCNLFLNSSFLCHAIIIVLLKSSFTF